ncbi:MAG TPA: hypothetical protein VFE47_21635 [Tepidisphaeraceae bacterium]|jgi:hypothetical protein|nr:hypothetical protein [Tepidisphaeraceae bacterium]
MTNRFFSLPICLFALISVAPAFAAEARLATPGKVLFEDDFSRADMAPKWKVGKGSFVIKDGVVTAGEIPGDMHGAYAYVKPAFEFKDIVAEFSVRLDGCRACNLMINDSKYKESHAGHICRATLLMGKVDLADYKFGAMKNDIFEKMKDPATTPDEKKKLRESIKDKSSVTKTAVDLSQWHVVRVEIVGDEMLLSLDGKPAGYLKSAGIDHPTKNAIGFEIGGKSCEIKNMQVWEATASPDWAKERDEVIGGLKK